MGEKGSSPACGAKYKKDNAMSIKEMVAGKQVNFVRYQRGEIWYVTECGFEFPVPIEDTGDAAFQNSDKAMFFMRWIRKHQEMLAEAKQTVM